jgi:hypothetical protein
MAFSAREARSQGASSAAQAPAAAKVAVVVVREQEGPGGRVVLNIVIRATDVVLGSYQGSFRYDPTVLEVDSATTVPDGYRVVNTAGAKQGAIRFAGFTTSKFGDDRAVRIVARLRKPIAEARIEASLDVAGDVEGHAIPRGAMTPARGTVPRG